MSSDIQNVNYLENPFKEYTDYTPFDVLKVTLQAHTVVLQGTCDKEAIYELLPVHLISLPEGRKKKKIKIPHFPELSGKVVSIAYGNNSRGIYRNPFVHCSSAVMCLKQKNIAIKFYQNVLQLAGAQNIEHVNECLEYLKNYIIKIQENLDYIQNNKSKAEKTLKWISDNLAKSDDTLNDLPNEADSPDSKISNFLLSYYQEFNRWNDYKVVMDWILETARIISPDFEMKHITTIMTNYNFFLGFKINRDALAMLCQQKTVFKTFYDKGNNHSVKLILPYVRDETFKYIKKKKTDTHHTIQIYKSGKVTFSSANSELMRPIYNYFRSFICSVKQLIDYSDMIEVNEITQGVEKINVVQNPEEIDESIDEIDNLADF